MNEKLQYATMLEIPVNTANITYKPLKKRRKAKLKNKNPEAVKEELMQKVNSETAETFAEETALQENAEPQEEINYEESVQSASVHKKERKPFFKFSAVGLEVVAVFTLVAIIFLTNAFYTDSAINVFMRKVFSPTATETVKEKTYDEFKPVVNFGGDVTLEDGVISCTGSGAVYSALDGTVTSVTLDGNGTYTVEIAHSGVFSSKISGLSYAYLNEGDAVFGNIPVGYIKDGGFTMCFNSEDAIITDYTIEDNAVLWAV